MHFNPEYKTVKIKSQPHSLHAPVPPPPLCFMSPSCSTHPSAPTHATPCILPLHHVPQWQLLLHWASPLTLSCLATGSSTAPYLLGIWVTGYPSTTGWASLTCPLKQGKWSWKKGESKGPNFCSQNSIWVGAQGSQFNPSGPDATHGPALGHSFLNNRQNEQCAFWRGAISLFFVNSLSG